jgi:hypothetical protein
MLTVSKSKIGLELSIPLLLIFGGLSVVMAFYGEPQNILLDVIIICCIAHLFLTTKYTISGNNLNVK